MQSLWRETYISLQNTILKAFCSYSLPSVGFTAPSGPVRGSAPSFVSLFSLQTLSINQTHTTMQKHFSFGFSHPLKQFQKTNLQRKIHFSSKLQFLKLFVHRPPPSARGSAPSFVSRFSLQPFLDKPLFYQTA